MRCICVLQLFLTLVCLNMLGMEPAGLVEMVADYQGRRQQLLARVREAHSDKSGPILLLADYDSDGASVRFRQESFFYYFTGIELPGVALLIEQTGRTTLFVPNFGEGAGVWTNNLLMTTSENAEWLKVDEVTVLGRQRCLCTPLAEREVYEQLLGRLKTLLGDGATLFTLCESQKIKQCLLLARFEALEPGLTKTSVDIMPIVAQMRRKKDLAELALLHCAVNNTVQAQQVAAQVIRDGVCESWVQASAEYVMTRAGMRQSFPSVVASGRNATVLHYEQNSDIMRDGQLIVVDIGASCGHYCADLTRTYPVSGRFTARQRELYNIVLGAQEHVERLAMPGMWLFNNENAAISLHHHAKEFIDRAGYGHYFPHAIGHSLGLDVHDVADRVTPLHEGDVITIEPGIYIPDQEVGIRIEDDYLIGENGAVCLSAQLPKRPDEVESMMRC